MNDTHDSVVVARTALTPRPQKSSNSLSKNRNASRLSVGSFLAFAKTADIQAVTGVAHITALHREDKSVQKRFGKLGKSIFHRYTKNRYGIESYVPDMRFMKLPSRPDALHGFEKYSKEAEDLLQKMKSSSMLNYISIADSSAKGKTSLIFQLATYQFIMYVVANTEALPSDHVDRAYYHLVAEIGKVVETPKINSGMKEIKAKLLIEVDLLSRLALLHCYLETCLDNPDQLEALPKTFLLLQLCGGNSLVTSISERLISSGLVSKSGAELSKCLRELMASIKSQIIEVNKRRAEKNSLPPIPLRVGVAVDEAQASTAKFKEHFVRENSSEHAGMLYMYAHAIAKMAVRPLILSGTAITYDTLKPSVTMAGKRDGIVAPIALPYLKSEHILERYKLCLNMDEVDCDNQDFQKALAKLEGRPRLSTSAIEKHLQNVVKEYPYLRATSQLTKAMERSFEDMVCYIVDVVSDKMAYTSTVDEARAMTAMVRKLYAVVKLGGKVSVRDVCAPEDRDRLIAAALCFPAPESSTVRFDEPLLREVVTRVGDKNGWEVTDILHELFFSYLNSNSTDSTNGKNYQLETVFALQMSQKDGMTIADFLAPFMTGKTILPKWTAKSTLEFSSVDLKCSGNVSIDLEHIKQVLEGSPRATRDRSLWLPSDRLRPDVLSINPKQGYVLLCGVRWLKKNDSSDQKQDSDLVSLQSSVKMDCMGLQKSGEEHNESAGMKKLRTEVVGKLVARKEAVKKKGKGGQSEENRPLNELRVMCALPNISRNDSNNQQGVIVDEDGRTVTLIIHKHNFHHFFGKDAVQVFRAKMDEQ